MYELIYCSHAKKEFSEDQLLEMLKSFRASNNKHQITGILVYDNMDFIQLLEGEKKSVLQLYENISADGRHTNVNLFFEGAIPNRNFPEWSMGFIKNGKFSSDMSGFSNIFENNLTAVITEKHKSIGTHLFKALCSSLYFDRFGNMAS